MLGNATPSRVYIACSIAEAIDMPLSKGMFSQLNLEKTKLEKDGV